MRPRRGPVWWASRAAVRRRKVQTTVIGIVVFLAAVTSVAALGLLMAASEPFDHAFSSQNGPHSVAVFDSAKATDAQLAATGSAAGVAASAGPFREAGASTLDPLSGGLLQVNVVGRADPGGAVDRLNLWRGRWAAGPGEVVLDQNTDGGSGPFGPQIGDHENVQTADGTAVSLTIVGFAYSVAGSADQWVSPAQIAALHPTRSEMLYRFAHADSGDAVTSSLSTATGGLPSGALLGSQSWLTTKGSVTQKLALFIPIMTTFGVLGIAVAALIVLNVVGGAVVAGFRDIGVYKTIGFTPWQTCGVYLTMMAVPALTGTVLGLPAGVLLATPMLDKAFRQFGSSVGVSPWAVLLAGLGMIAMVAAAALLPALRAARLPATVAITAGSAPRRGRGLTTQRRLAGSRLPRSVSMGLGLPFARPARSILTLAAVLLGVTTVTFANGLVRSMSAFSTASDRNGAVQLTLTREETAQPGGTVVRHSGAATAALLRATPGVVAVAESRYVRAGVVGSSTDGDVHFYGGDSGQMGYVMVTGHWLDGPDQVVVSSRYLHRNGVRLGDPVTLELSGKQVRATVVGETVTGSDHTLYAGMDVLAELDDTQQPDGFEMRLAPGTDATAVAASLRGADPGFDVGIHDIGDPNTQLVVFATVFTVLLSAVAALGVFNTVLLTTRERRRDLGMLKSIGMTPRQVVAMVVTSMALLGLVGGLLGLPLGCALHGVVMPIMARGTGVGVPHFVMAVYTPQLLAWLFLAGIGIAVFGALLPARSAGRLTIAEVLHNE